MVAGRPFDRVLDGTIDTIDNGVRHLPIIDDAERFVGMVFPRRPGDS